MRHEWERWNKNRINRKHCVHAEKICVCAWSSLNVFQLFSLSATLMGFYEPETTHRFPFVLQLDNSFPLCSFFSFFVYLYFFVDVYREPHVHETFYCDERKASSCMYIVFASNKTYSVLSIFLNWQNLFNSILFVSYSFFFFLVWFFFVFIAI